LSGGSAGTGLGGGRAGGRVGGEAAGQVVGPLGSGVGELLDGRPGWLATCRAGGLAARQRGGRPGQTTFSYFYLFSVIREQSS